MAVRASDAIAVAGVTPVIYNLLPPEWTYWELNGRAVAHIVEEKGQSLFFGSLQSWCDGA